MAAKKLPGIKKPAPRSSKVVPINADDVDNIKWAAHIARCDKFMAEHTKPALQVVQRPDNLRQKLANWLESFARWVRA